MDKVINIPQTQIVLAHGRSTGLYLYGDLYVADEYMRETNQYKKQE